MDMEKKTRSACIMQALDYMRKGKGNIPVRVFHALESGPLAYRTFGGQERICALSEETMERVFGGDYLLTILTGTVASKFLHAKGSVHTFYTDSEIYRFFQRHGLLDCGLWDDVDYMVLDKALSAENFDYRWAYSACKPYATLEEIARREKVIQNGGEKMPLLFHDADLILRQSFDCILNIGCEEVEKQTSNECFMKEQSMLRFRQQDDMVMAVGHIEEVGTPFYPPFEEIYLPECLELQDGMLVDKKRGLSYRTDLPAVNTCLMYFSDMEVAEEWAYLFEDFMRDNHAPVKSWLEGEQQLLTADQRPGLMVAERRNLKLWKDIGFFVPLTWTGKDFKALPNSPVSEKEWHYYRPDYLSPEQYPNVANWNQTIQHTWIQKLDIERHVAYGNYMGCFHLELLQNLCQELGLNWEKLECSLKSFSSLERYFALFDSGKTIEELLVEEKKKPVHERKIDDVLIKGLEKTMFPQ